MFVAALQADFNEHGVEAIQKVREDRPEAYLKVIAQILPRDLNLKTENDLSEISETELTDMIMALKTSLSGAVDDDMDDQPASPDDAFH